MTHTDQLHPRVQFTNSEGLLTPFAFKFLVNVYEKLGGPNDLIQELEVGELYEPGLETGLMIDTRENLPDYDFHPTAPQEEQDFHVPQVPVQMFTAVTKDADYTALSFDFIAVTKKATIKLPSNPDDNDQVIVINAKGKEVTVDGNGKRINNDTSTRSLRQNTGIVYQYFIDLDQWYMR